MIRDLPNLYQQGNFENVSKTNYITWYLKAENC
jgi:hypothetical protein